MARKKMTITVEKKDALNLGFALCYAASYCDGLSTRDKRKAKKLGKQLLNFAK